MRATVAGLVVVVAAACVASFRAPGDAGAYLTLDRSKRANGPAARSQSVMKHARNTRHIPINADLVIRRVAPGSLDGPVDLHHEPWDWLEVYNRSKRAIPLAGYSLSDNPDRIRKYRFPSLVLPPRSAARIWLSGFVSMNSDWSLTPIHAVDARGWKAERNDDRADRFTYMWLGFEPAKTAADKIEWPVRIDEPGRYAIWLHAGTYEENRPSRLAVAFRDTVMDVILDNPTSLADYMLACPDSKDGYWDLDTGTHPVHCAVIEGKSLINQVAVFRYDEPIGWGRQELHAGFQLKQSGEFLGLFDPKGVVVDHLMTPALQTGSMITRDPNRGGKLLVEPVGVITGMAPLPLRPRFDVQPGRVAPGTHVRITVDDPDIHVRYTLNGDLPDLASPRVTGSLPLDSNTVLRARAFDATGRYGPVAAASYWVEDAADLPILSVIAEPDQLYDYSHGMMYNTGLRGIRSERWCHLTLIEPDGRATATVGGIRIQGRSSRKIAAKRNFRIVFRERYGQLFWPGPLFAGEGPERCRAVVAIGRNMIRNQLAHDIMDMARVRSPRRKAVRMFVNGEPYGLYLLLEDVQDPHYLEGVFGHLDLDVIKEKTFQPVKRGSRTRFDEELLTYVNKANAEMTYDRLKGLMDIDQLSRWVAVVQFAGIDDSGQGYYVCDYRAEGPAWSFINWDFDNAFTLTADKGWPQPQGYRSRLLLPVKNSSATYQKQHYFPALQYMVNHVMPLSHLPVRARNLVATYSPYLDEEFDAHLNQRCFLDDIPDREAFIAAHYRDQWEQILRFVDTRMNDVPAHLGKATYRARPHVVRIECAGHYSQLVIDSWPAHPSYVGHYYPTTSLSVRWADPADTRELIYEINGTEHRVADFSTNVTENLVIRIRDT